MRVVFLDIDGVLFTKKSSRTYAASLAAGRSFPCDDDMVREFDPDAVKNLRHLLEITDARVVVSSTWRLRSSPARLAALLGRQGITPVIGATGRQRPTRGREVMEWLQAQPALTSFVILDDMSDELDVLFPSNYVRCDPTVGLADTATLLKAISVLEGSAKPGAPRPPTAARPPGASAPGAAVARGR